MKAFVVLLLGATSLLASDTIEIAAHIQDRAWRESTGINVNSATARIGTETAGQRTGFAMPFLLPAIPVGMEIAHAEILVFVETQANLNGEARAELLGGRLNPLPSTQSEDARTAPVLVPGAHRLNSAIPLQSYLSFTSNSLVSTLREGYRTNPQFAGQYIFFAVAPDVANTQGSRYITVATANSTNPSRHPKLRLILRPIENPTVTISHNGVTWRILGQSLQTGNFVTGDPWVLGPITIVEITNNLNSPLFTPRPGQNGTMINPLSGHSVELQGYDDGLASYRAHLNSGLPNGQPVSRSNPLVVSSNSTVISAVSWLYRNQNDREPGCPNWNTTSNTPRPAIRSAGVLTVLSSPPPADAFRPAYSGTNKEPRFRTSQLRMDRLRNLPPPPNPPNPNIVVSQLTKPWIDHVYEFLGAMIHPSEHMPNYGRDMADILINASLLANTDFSRIPGAPPKINLVVPLVQFGLDTMGVVANGGGFPANGGHHQGRFWPVLFAGLMLDDPMMMDVGRWGRNRGGANRTPDRLAGLVEFQEFQQFFYISPADVAMSGSSQWNPDTRGDMIPYTSGDVGMPEWGVRYTSDPRRIDRALNTPYRNNNAGRAIGFALAARIMGAQALWNHDAYFDYADRYMPLVATEGADGVPSFVSAMWNLYYEQFSVISYNTFLRSQYSPAEMGDPAITGPSVILPQIERSNWEVFFFNGSPTDLRPEHLPQIYSTASNLSLRYQTRQRPPNFNASWMQSSNLIDWSPVLPISRRVEESPSGGFWITDEFPPSPNERVFFRLETQLAR